MSNPTHEEIYELLNNAFKDITLCLGGIFLAYKTNDKVIWAITKSLEDIYYKTMSKLEDTLGTGIAFNLEDDIRDLHPHPAIEGLLKVINCQPAQKRVKK